MGSRPVYPVSEIRVSGDIRDGGQIIIGGNLNGKILVEGSLEDSVVGDEIAVGGVLGDTAAIVVDWDGWDSADEWQTGATVSVGQTVYTGNTPSDRVYEVTPCKGDMDNDYAVTFDDIKPFVTALSGVAGFEAKLPGLGGCMGFHADANCDGLVTFDDIKPFAARIGQCCRANCEPCPEGEGAGIAPEDFAAGFAEDASYDVLDAFMTLACDLAESEPDPAERAYWEVVCEYLQE